jgi:hypothetical protein
MAVGDKITAQRFNQVRNKVAQVLGSGGTNPNTGSTDRAFGYGQALTSYQVNQFDEVTLADITSLRSDLVKARRHQTDIDYGALSQINSNEYLGVFTNDTEIRESDWEKYNRSADNIVNNRFSVGENSLILETYADAPQGSGSKGGNLDTRNSEWVGALVSEVRIDFNSQREADYFFNAGGKIVVSPRLDYLGNDNKTLKWKELLNDWITSVRISYNKTESFPKTSSKKTISDFGWYQLPTAPNFQEVFKKTSEGAYAGNFYSIQAATNASRDRITIRVTFDDQYTAVSYQQTDPNTGVVYTVSEPDTPILGILTSEISQLRPYNASLSYVRVVGPVAYVEIQGI